MPDILELLIAERDRLNEAIVILGARARVRPLSEKESAPSKEQRPATSPAKKTGTTWSAAERKAHSERLKKFWAARREAATG